jgi:NTE family protein
VAKTKRALVLGGGGVAGIAWETGLLFGLAEHGVDVRDADLVVGTSAGAAVGAQIRSGTPLGQLYDRHVMPDAPSTEIDAEFDAEKMMRDFGALLAAHPPGPELRAALGAMALGAPTVPERARRDAVAARLPSPDWPAEPLLVVAVDAATGAERVFSAADGVSLVDAVAASCAVPGVWPPATVAGRRYIDGGVRSSTNVDLAAKHSPVLVLAPMPDLGPLDPAVEKAAGKVVAKADVLTIKPDEASLAAIGANPLDPATARPAAQAGRAQASAHVDAVRALWQAT